MASGHGLLRAAERKHRWPVAAAWGAPPPYGFQSVLARADWDADRVREELRPDSSHHLGAPHGVLVLDATGVVHKGRPSAGVARPDTGTVGTGETCHIGVGLSSAGPLGQALWARAR
jgi:SRSO17 transposase